MACNFHAVMYKISPTTPLIALAMLSACAWAPAALAVEPATDVAIQIEADALVVDEKQQISIFSGAVKLERGPLTIYAERLELREFDGGRQEGIASGTPALFERQSEAEPSDPGATDAEKITGSAERITYDSQQETLLLEGQAVLQRWRNGQLRDETTGPRITYTDATGLFTVDGGAQSVSQPKRVTATISPKKASPKGQ